MEKTYHYVKKSFVTFKLDQCCWLAPLRVGICLIAYLNIVISLISLVGIANESFSPTILKIQEVIIPDFVSKPIPILAYCTELAFNVLLLCAMYRKDIELTRAFMYYNITTIIASTLFYSMVLPAMDVLLTVTIVFSLIYQIYLLVLVRSAIVQIKEERVTKNGKVPTEFVFSTLKKEHTEPEPVEKSEAIEVNEQPITTDQVITDEPKKEEETEKKDIEDETKTMKGKKKDKKKEKKVKGKEKDTDKEKDKLETVEEHPNEVKVEINAPQ